MRNKFNDLKNYLSEIEKQGLYLAFSGGIDSTLLLYLCKDLKVTAVTLKSVFQPEAEINEAQRICRNYNIEHIVIEYFPLENEVLVKNLKDRCYHCKKIFFSKLKEIAKGNVVIDGTNFDDTKTYRPGLRALKELGVISPFVKFQITKEEIRNYAKECGIEIFDKPSSPCLATRFPYGETLTLEKLKMAEKAESIIKAAGFEANRFRIHNDIARIEIPIRDFGAFVKKSDLIEELKKCGDFKYITLDLEGLRSGSMDK